MRGKRRGKQSCCNKEKEGKKQNNAEQFVSKSCKEGKEKRLVYLSMCEERKGSKQPEKVASLVKQDVVCVH